jgi:hypothetical protein
VRKLLDKLAITNNLAVNTRGDTDVVVARDLKGFRNLAGSPANPVALGFKDRDAGDLSLSDTAGLLKAQPSFKPIPSDRIGLVVDDYRRTLPPK